MSTKLTEAIEPWYRYRWPWLIMLGPFVVVIAGVITTYLAVVSNDGLVDDDYYKQGLAVNQITARDRRAVDLGLQAEIQVDAQRRLIRVDLRGNKVVVLPETLKLTIAHPTRSGMDQALVLHSDGTSSYSAGIVEPLTGRWHIALEDEGRREWRLAGDWVLEKQPVLKLPVAREAHQ